MVSAWAELKRRNVVRVAIAYAVVAWLLLQVADVVLDNIEAPTWVFQAILLLLVIGFPLALIFAWSFELTPEGIKKEKDVIRSESITHVTKRKLDYMIIGILSITVIYFVLDNFVLTNESSVGSEVEKSIAVLPFVAMTSGEDDGYFADGLTEELLNSLSQINDLKVAGRTSSFYFKGKTQSFQEVGEILGVTYVLEGSVRRAGNRLRITAQLINADDGFHLWSATYDRSMDDIFAIQEDIANQVTSALKVTLLGGEAVALARHGTNNAEAQSLYLIAKARLRLGRHASSGGIGLGSGHLRSARRLLEQAVGLDPDYAEAWAALGRAYLLVATNVQDASGEALGHPEAIRLSGEAIEKSMSLAPDLPEVRFANARHLWAVFFYRTRDTADLNRVITAYQEALERAPNDVDLLEALASVRSSVDDEDGAVALYDRALALDPMSQVRYRRARNIFWSGRLAEARAEFMRIGELYPETPWRLGIANIEFDKGHLHHALLWSADARVSSRPFAWASLGEMERAREELGLVLSLGGQVAKFKEFEDYFFERDYDGLQTWLIAHPDSTILWETLSQPTSWIARSYIRDWPAVLASFDAWSQRFPVGGENVRGAPAARERHFTTDSLIKHAGYAAYLAYTYQKNGAPDQAVPIWNWALELLDNVNPRTPQVGYEAQHVRALIAAGRGETSAALEGFEALHEAGWRWLMCGSVIGWGFYSGDMAWFEDSPLLDSIRAESRFIAVVEQVKADNAAMLAELNAGLKLEDIMDE